MTNPWSRIPSRLKKTALGLILAGTFIFLASLSTVVTFDVRHPQVPNKVDAVIVLGARVGTPALKYRTLTGLHYYQTGQADTIILSGAQGPDEPVSEAQAMAEVIKQEVARTGGTMPRLILETKSANTYQNLVNSRALLPGANKVVVVSDGYHLARSALIAKHLGFSAVYWDAPKPTYYATLDLAHYYIREAVALILHAPQYL